LTLQQSFGLPQDLRRH